MLSEIDMDILTNIPLLNNLLLAAFFVVFAFVFWKENKNEKSPLHWIDLLIDEKKNKLSITKFGQFWGIAISTWITIALTQKLTADQVAGIYPWIFGTWLTFLVAATGIKSFVMSKDKTTVEMKDKEKEEETK